MGDPTSVRDRVPATLTRLAAWTAFDETIRPATFDVGDTLVGTPPPNARAGATAKTMTLANHEDLEIVDVLAEGGMGRILLAKQRSLQRDVAIKTVRPDLDASTLDAALHEESVIAGSLEHPNIIPIHALGSDGGGRPFLVMKRIEGVAWSELVRDPAHPAWERAGLVGGDRLAANLAILIAVCSAVHHSHRRGILHRDIKPSNVMVGELGEVYLVDWGIATAIAADDARCRKAQLGLVGTPGFLAPEMVAEDGGAIDERTDVYLLGATLHYVMTNTLRHRANTLDEAFDAALASSPTTYDAAVPEELGAIANRACARDPAERYPSAAAFRVALLEFLTHRASIAASDRARTRLDDATALARATPVDRPQLRRLLTEARYGFTHALEAWSGNPRAREGLRACAILALRDDVAQGNLVGAEAALLELDDPPADLRAAIEGLRADARERAERDARFREHEAQHDWRRSAGARVTFFLVLLAITTSLWIWINGGLRYQDALSRPQLAAIVGVGLLVLVAMVAVARTRLLTSQVNAKLVYGLVLAVAAMFVNRVANCIEVPYPSMLVSTELVFAGLAAALGGLTLSRWLWLQVPLWIGGAFVVRAIPDYGGAVFMTTAILCLAVGLWQTRR